VLEQIPTQSPTLIDRLLIQRPIIPYEDLNIKGQVPYYLELFRDVGINLALMYGMSEVGPRMVSMTPDNAIRVAQGGAGLTNLKHDSGKLLANTTQGVTFPTARHVVMISLDAESPLAFPSPCQFIIHEPGVFINDPFDIYDGERWIIEQKCIRVELIEQQSINWRYRVAGWDYQNVLDSLPIATNQ
jgi:hypothetical protein